MRDACDVYCMLQTSCSRRAVSLLSPHCTTALGYFINYCLTFAIVAHSKWNILSLQCRLHVLEIVNSQEEDHSLGPHKHIFVNSVPPSFRSWSCHQALLFRYSQAIIHSFSTISRLMAALSVRWDIGQLPVITLRDKQRTVQIDQSLDDAGKHTKAEVMQQKASFQLGTGIKPMTFKLLCYS